MQLKQKTFRSALGALVAALMLASVALAQGAADQLASEKTKIKNFGQMDERFYRGAQPKEEDLKVLAAMGIKTIVDLRHDPKPYEKPIAESLGMKYVNIPMISKKYPTEEATAAFLKLINDPETGKFYVHCAGGRHRTGAMGAVYRFKLYDWSFDQAYAEMKKFDFYTSWGHGAFKDFVEDYYQRVQADKTQAAKAPVQPNKAPTATTTTPTIITTKDSILVSDSVQANDQR
jgi:protein tyrosine phosphatase (PTP) superfamily phosphohydrolase (DUF442 family)